MEDITNKYEFQRILRDAAHYRVPPCVRLAARTKASSAHRDCRGVLEAVWQAGRLSSRQGNDGVLYGQSRSASLSAVLLIVRAPFGRAPRQADPHL